MEFAEITARLKELCPDAVVEEVTDEAATKDPFAVVASDRLREVMKAIKEDQELRFDLLISISAVGRPSHREGMAKTSIAGKRSSASSVASTNRTCSVIPAASATRCSSGCCVPFPMMATRRPGCRWRNGATASMRIS